MHRGKCYIPLCMFLAALRFYYVSALHYIGKVLLHTHACSGIAYLQLLYPIGYSFTKVNHTYPSKTVLLYACNFTRVRHSHIRERMCYKYPMFKEIVKKQLQLRVVFYCLGGPPVNFTRKGTIYAYHIMLLLICYIRKALIRRR